MKSTFLLLALTTLFACGRDDMPGADTDSATPPGRLPADSTVQVPVPADNIEAPVESGEDALQDDDPSGTGSDGSARDPARTGEAAASPAPPANGAASPDVSQNDVASILRAAAAAYDGVQSMRADFVMNREIPVLRQTITSRGTLYQQSPDRIALLFSDPDGDVIMSDGRHFWVYYPSVNPDQVIQSPAAEGGRSGVDLQAQFVGDPVERFDATLHGTEPVAGRPAHVLTLVPRANAEYRSLKVWLDARDSLARRFEIVEHNGSTRRFDLSGLRTNVSIPASTFQFTPPAGARVIQPGS